METNAEKYIGMMLDGRYEILELIGRGGMANVYKAKCHKLKRYDAVKIMRDDDESNENFKKYFRAESQAVAMLSHPNIVSVYDVGESDGIEYIVMELVDGITLKEYMENHGPLRPDEALSFSIQIARALAHAHSRGIIHRDIKPQNVMLLADGLIKVADFGIAALSSEGSDGGDETIGSVHYIAPEQARGRAADARSDVYSLGIVMYEMLTGQLPFIGSSEAEVAAKHMNEVAKNPRELVPSIPEELERICLKAMSAGIKCRYQSAAELLSDLEQFGQQPSEGDRIVTEEIDSDGSGEGGKKKKAKKSKKRTIGSGIIAVLVLIILVFVFIICYFARDFFASPEQIEVESFKGRYFEDVLNDTDYDETYRFTVSFVDDTEHEYGIIIGQTPEDGALRTLRAKKDRAEVELIISSGNAGSVTDDKAPVEVPDIVNDEQTEAIDKVRGLGFSYAIYEAASPSIARGYVISSDPAAGEFAPFGSEVVITVSAGPDTILSTVPNLKGLSKEAAIGKIESAKLSLDRIDSTESDFEAGTVIWQSLEPGQSVEEHTLIRIQISKGPAESGDRG